MLPLLTSTRHVHDQRPPEFPWALNEDSSQAQGLVCFWPLGYELYNERDCKANYNLSVFGPTMETSGFPVRSRLFDDASTQYLQIDSAPVTAVPFTMAAWFNSNDATVTQDLISVVNSASVIGTNAHRLTAGGATAGDPVRASSDGAIAVSSTGYSTNTWHHACGVWTTNALRAAFIDGGRKGTNTTSLTPTGLNRVTIGGFRQATAASVYMSGQIAHACIWNRAFGDDEVTALTDPETRWELYYPLGRKTWSFKPAAGGVAGRLIGGRLVGGHLTRSRLVGI